MEVIIAPKARRDIANILFWSQENFGLRARRRYAKLIETAIAEIAANPDCLGSMHRPEIANNCRTYHHFHARKKAGVRGNRVGKPRHFLLYRTTDAGVVELGRVLHDSMDFAQHLPDEYRGTAE
jgi:toxin ParE1/3/4